MKRKALARGTKALARKTALAARSELARSAGLARGKRLARGRGPKPGRRARPPEGPLSREDWGAEVARLAHHRCAVTGASIKRPRPINLHHCVPKQRLRRDGRHDLVWDPDNGVLVAAKVHADHEAASRRIPLAKLPARCRRFAEAHGYERYVDETYG